jgi:hypothetical protein
MKICLSRHLYFASYINLFRVLFEKNGFEKKRNVFPQSGGDSLYKGQSLISTR